MRWSEGLSRPTVAAHEFNRNSFVLKIGLTVDSTIGMNNFPKAVSDRKVIGSKAWPQDRAGSSSWAWWS